MSNHATLSAALLAAFNLDADGAKPEVIADAAADVLCAFADAVRGPAPAVAQPAAIELVRDETPALILSELRKQNAILSNTLHLLRERERLNSALDNVASNGAGAGAGAQNSGLLG